MVPCTSVNAQSETVLLLLSSSMIQSEEYTLEQGDTVGGGVGYRLLSRCHNQGCHTSFCSGRVGFIKCLSGVHF